VDVAVVVVVQLALMNCSSAFLRNGRNFSVSALDSRLFSSICTNPRLFGQTRPSPSEALFETWWQPAHVCVVARARTLVVDADRIGHVASAVVGELGLLVGTAHGERGECGECGEQQDLRGVVGAIFARVTASTRSRPGVIPMEQSGI
jgi:hypothetical protein